VVWFTMRAAALASRALSPGTQRDLLTLIGQAPRGRCQPVQASENRVSSFQAHSARTSNVG
jgi:hypothetical protein